MLGYRGTGVRGRDIVVVGASAGGQQALGRLVGLLPAKLPAAIFAVMHRSAAHGLVEFLSAQTQLPIRLAVNSERFQAGNMYVCPGDYHLSLENGLMRVEHSPKEGLFRPNINALFRSAALAYGRRVVGVILTGRLDDGVAGLWQIKKHGGVAIVQDPAEAEYPAMPQSAIDGVSVDYVLPIEGIARKVVELAGQAQDHPVSPAPPTRVLIVEDERLVAESLKEQLEDLGYLVCGSAGSGEGAIKRMAEGQPDVVLMDIHLAGRLTGIETARRIWERFQVPIIYITAYADPDTLEEVKTTENYGYIVKPFHAKAVHAAIQLALDRREKEMRHA